ncbi:MAG TPA: hypothetical protein VGC30_12655 [Dokdonella sp.]
MPRVSAPRLQRRYAARRRRPPGARLAFGAIVCAALAAAAFSLGSHGVTALGAVATALRAHVVALATAAALAGGVLAQNARRGAERAFAASWLASAPLEPGEIAAELRAQAVRRSTPALVVAVAALLATAFAGGGALAAFSAGGAGGVALGWRAGRRSRAVDAAPPRLARPRAGAARRVSLAALARWPIAHALADADPRLHARLVGAALLALPTDVPLRIVVAGLGAAAAAGGAFALLRGCVAVAPAAAVWLRSTPIAPIAFAAALARRALAGIGAAAAVVGVAVLVLGGSAAAALTIAAGLAAGAATVFGSAFARRDAPARLRFELAALAAVLAAAAAVAWPAAFALLPAIWIWQWRRALAA